MSDKTKIPWADSTWNPWIGCQKVSAGCQNCYAERYGHRFSAGWGKPYRQSSEATLRLPFRWNKRPWVCPKGHASEHHMTCFKCGVTTSEMHRRRVFTLSLGDWLDPHVPVEWLAGMLDTIRRCDKLQWILATKRPELWEERMHAAYRIGAGTGFLPWMYDWAISLRNPNPPKNVILLASVENQKAADERIPALLQIPAACRGLSIEPLLGPIDLSSHRLMPLYSERGPSGYGGNLDWLIIGGESGPNARPCNVEWIRSLVSQGQQAGVPVFVKQLGRVPIDCGQRVVESPNGGKMWVPFKRQIKCIDREGRDPAEWPEDLRVREWPKGF